jgi:threonine dehydrogenase-like Zn-dependent dehydrogenase
VAALCAGLPGADVTVVDLEASRAKIAGSLGAKFVAAADFAALGEQDADVVFHASSSAQGLALALGCAGLEAGIVEMSWYGAAAVAAPLGEAFHAKRLRLISSQVGQVSPSRRPRWNFARRLDKALELLADARFDALITDEIAFEDAPRELPRILAPGAKGLATVLRY